MIRFIKSRIVSFANAFTGLKDILSTEHNALVHAVCTLIVLLLSCWLALSSVEFILILMVIALVWITEAFNTVLEIVIDIASPEYCEAARRAKDIAAAGVLFAALLALAAGLFILLPHVINKLYAGFATAT
jgi:diacylglycerol kinase